METVLFARWVLGFSHIIILLCTICRVIILLVHDNIRGWRVEVLVSNVKRVRGQHAVRIDRQQFGGSSSSRGFM